MVHDNSTQNPLVEHDVAPPTEIELPQEDRLLYTKPAPPPTAREILAAAKAEAEAEEQDGENAYCDSGSSPPQKVVNAAALQKAYVIYEKNPTAQAFDDLIIVVERFARTITLSSWSPAVENLRHSQETNSPNGMSSVIACHVMEKFGSFRERKEETSFSGWVARLGKNLIRDEVRKGKRREAAELGYAEAKLHEESDGCRKVGGSGTAPCGGEEYASHLLARNTVEDSEADRIDRPESPTISDFEDTLSAEDLRVYHIMAGGGTCREVVAQLKISGVEAKNRFAKIKRLVGEWLKYEEVLVHTCRHTVGAVTESELRADAKYVKTDLGFHELTPCRCRRKVTRMQAEELKDCGESQSVYKLGKKGVVVVQHVIFSPQQSMVARVGLTSAAHMERSAGGNRRDERDIDIAHQITLLERARLIPANHLVKAPTGAIIMPRSGETDVLAEGEKCACGNYRPAPSPTHGSRQYCTCKFTETSADVRAEQMTATETARKEQAKADAEAVIADAEEVHATKEDVENLKSWNGLHQRITSSYKKSVAAKTYSDAALRKSWVPSLVPKAKETDDDRWEKVRQRWLAEQRLMIRAEVAA